MVQSTGAVINSAKFPRRVDSDLGDVAFQRSHQSSQALSTPSISVRPGGCGAGLSGRRRRTIPNSDIAMLTLLSVLREPRHIDWPAKATRLSSVTTFRLGASWL